MMAELFGIKETIMQETNCIATSKEIFQQPLTWGKTCNQIKTQKEEIQKFIDQVITCKDYDVILTGAGTSEFVGSTLYPYLGKDLQYKIKSYGTTDLVATPEAYLSKIKPTLLISFGRSGNSPESIGAVEVADEVCDTVYHLFITCNKDGELSKRASRVNNCYAINLTDETHDQGFAMTSSFTNMCLAAYLALRLDVIDQAIKEIDEIKVSAQIFLEKQYMEVKNVIDTYDFKRIVYLGSNSLKAIAQESALKMLELTAGKVTTMFDTPLGFRHGPKSIIDDDTLIVVYISDDIYTRQYEIDLIKEMVAQRKGNRIMVVTSTQENDISGLTDYAINFHMQSPKNSVLLAFDYILVAQILAMYKSLSLDITPDDPCPTGEVNRVVKGVKIYPYTRK